MSICKVLKTFCRISTVQKVMNSKKHSLLQCYTVHFNQVRNMRKSFAQVSKAMRIRRELLGPDKLRKRSDWYGWDYDSELYAFSKRLHENITSETMRCIFVHDSYIHMEEQKRKEMSVSDIQINLKSNTDLSARGEDILKNFLSRYLRAVFRFMPEEGICAVYRYLTSCDVLSHISYNIGTKDLIFSAEYPPNNETLSVTLKAVIGGIAIDDSIARAETFILDFVCPQLIGKDVLEIWEINNPLQVLNSILQKQGREATESRLVFESGRNSLEAVYHVALYSNKQFLGRGVGETLNFAEEMAAYDVLRKLFRLNESKDPLPFGKKARSMDFKSEKANVSLNDLCGK